MPSIVVATLNARYYHSSFGLRYLMANMGELRDQTCMMEFVINDQSTDILSQILEAKPKIVGFGVYIWNVEPMTRLVEEIKRVCPEITIVLGGPEVSYEARSQRIVQLADYVISGEADVAFPILCNRILQGEMGLEKFLYPTPPTFDQLQLPYEFYDQEDIDHRVIYVEVSRGCPFTCEFCLSSLAIPVRMANVEQFLQSMQRLLDRGALQFKFVDRTFNLNLRLSQSILQFFLDRYMPGMFLHFEMIPDRLPIDLRKLISQFPEGSLQFEIGIQSFNDQVGQLISRHQDNDKLADNFQFLRNHTGVHIHADLIVGLPGETLESFAQGFDRLYELGPQEIQIGILKRLRGTPITRHDEPWQMVYSPHPPYEILSNRILSFDEIHRLRRFARYWDLIGNSGNFIATLDCIMPKGSSAFSEFSRLCDWLHARNPKRYGISLAELFASVFEYLTTPQIDSGCESRYTAESIAERMWNDYTRGGRRDRPAFLRPFNLPSPERSNAASCHESRIPVRQNRRIAAP